MPATFRRGKTTSLWALRRSLLRIDLSHRPCYFGHIMPFGSLFGLFGAAPARPARVRPEDQQVDPDDAEQHGPQTFVQAFGAAADAGYAPFSICGQRDAADGQYCHHFLCCGSVCIRYSSTEPVGRGGGSLCRAAWSGGAHAHYKSLVRL